MGEATTKNWIEYSQLVLQHIATQSDLNRSNATEFTEIRVQLENLKVKASIAGTIAGLIGGLIFTLIATALKGVIGK